MLNSHLNVCFSRVKPILHTFLPSSGREESCITSTCTRGSWPYPFQPYPLYTHHSNPPINQFDLGLTYHHASFFASWSSTWSLIRAWAPPLREENFPSATNITPNSPPLPPFKAQVLNTWLLINAASARLQHHPHRSYLPSHYTTPSFFHQLLDGENMPPPGLPNPPQLTTNNSSSNHPCRLIPPFLLNFQCPSKVQASVSSLVSALTFLDVYQTASNTSKARLLDNSTHQQGPSACMLEIRTIPLFEQGTDPISARAADLLACPPHLI